MYKFNFEPDDFQKEAFDCIDASKSIVVCAPTGAGKTCIAEYAIMKALDENTRLFYTTPLKALSHFHKQRSAYCCYDNGSIQKYVI